MDYLTIPGSSPESDGIKVPRITSEGLVSGEMEVKIKTEGLDGLTTDRWPIEVVQKWTTVPDLCYCVSCETVYFCRQDILTHPCAGREKESLVKRKNIEVKEQASHYIKEFISWLLCLVTVDNNPKQFANHLFAPICRERLIGAPSNCCFGGFIMWFLIETWGSDLPSQIKFIRKLYEKPKEEINGEVYPLSVKRSHHVPATICIYDVKKKVEVDGVNDRYKNCSDEDYDKVAYDHLKTCYRDDVKVEVELLSDQIAYGVVTSEKEWVTKFLSRENISEKEAEYILASHHRFSLGDAKRFLELFPAVRAESLDPETKWKYRLVENIWNIYGTKDDTVCLDLDDPATYGHFGKRIFKFIPIRRQFEQYGSPLQGDLVFEVFSITIRDLAENRDFSLIYMQSDASQDIPLIIYKRPEGKEVDIGKPLPLRIGLFRLPSPNSNVIISFTNKRTLEATWYFVHDSLYFMRRSMCCCNDEKHPYDNVVETEICMDKRNSSLATIKYRISLSALRAELAFTFFGYLKQKITVTDGYIVVTDNGEVGTKRFVQEYYEEKPVCLRSGQRLEVDRCVFGVPTGSYLRVKVKLVYFVDEFPEEKKMMEGYHDFKMPEYVSTQGLTVPASDGSTACLCVECSWTDN